MSNTTVTGAATLSGAQQTAATVETDVNAVLPIVAALVPDRKSVV